MIAALFVQKNGAYFGDPEIDPWDEARDARLYAGPHPVVAHPPCERWGRYWSGGPSAKVRRILGDDEGCFASALAAVRKWGGVLEHPAYSHAWSRFGLLRPNIGGSWTTSALDAREASIHVEQGHYGHPARKATWLYSYRVPLDVLPDLKRGPSEGRRLDEGFHSKAERQAARAAGRAPIKRLSTRENLSTPEAFRDVLVNIAKGARDGLV